MSEIEARYRLYADNVSEVICLADLDGRVEYISPSVEGFQGFTPEEVTGRDLENVLTPVSFQVARQTFGEALEVEGNGGEGRAQPFSMELEFLRIDGSSLWAEVRFHFRYDTRGRAKGILAVARDIDKRKRAELALKESEKRYRLLAENATDVIWTRDMDLRLTYLSPSITRMRGFSVEESMAQTLSESMTPASAALTRRIYEEELAIELQEEKDLSRSRTMNLEVTCRDGSTVWTEVTMTFLRDENDAAVGLLGISRDITDRKRVEDARRESELKFRSVFDFSPQPIALTEVTTGKFKEVNDRFCSITGFSREELLEKPATELGFYTEQDRQKVLEELIRAGEVREMEMHFRVKDGSIITCLIFSQIITIGAEHFVLTTFVDVTERKEFEARLKQSQKMEAIGTLAGGIAHDFNNILSIVVGNTEMAMQDLPRYGRTHFYLDESRKASLRARDLVKQILAFSRRAEKERKPILVGPIVEESVRMLRPSIPSTISIRPVLPPRKSTVLADPTQIHQVLINLCTNAAHAMRESKGVLEIALDNQTLSQADVSVLPSLSPGEYLVLDVRDTGHGIDPGIMERIFDPYFTTKGIGEGSGLGLAVVHGIVKERGGEVQVFSTPGKGSTFRLFFPLAETEVVEERDSDLPLPTGKESILLVDDDAEMAKLGKRMLKRLQYRVTGRKEGRAALKVFRRESERFDLVVTDMTMPDMTGPNLLQEFKRIRPDIPIIACTGYGEMITDEEADRMGIRAAVIKPLVMRELAQTVRQVLDEAQAGIRPTAS